MFLCVILFKIYLIGNWGIISESGRSGNSYSIANLNQISYKFT